MLRDDAKSHSLHLEIIARQDGAAEVEDIRETAGVKTMVEIIGDKFAERTLRVREGAAAIDKFFATCPTSVM
jgi:hypothetical protein